MEILKPYLLVACVAFTIGFVGYWAIGKVLLGPVAPVATEADAPGVDLQELCPDTDYQCGSRV